MPFFKDVLRDWSAFYPLCMDEFRYCHPRDIHGVHRRIQPECYNSNGQRITGCRLPLISMGKTIVRGGKLGRRCRGVFIHFCSQPSKAAKFARANKETELRIDHFKFRSLMKRTFSMPLRRRKGRNNLTAIIPEHETAFFSYEGNSFIQRWIPRVRESIGLLQPIAQYFDYRLVDRKDRWMVETVNEHTKCDPLLLLGQKQAMCPEDFPLADERAPMYKWCRKQGPERNITECPGFPDYPCCNYNQILDSKDGT